MLVFPNSHPIVFLMSLESVSSWPPRYLPWCCRPEEIPRQEQGDEGEPATFYNFTITSSKIFYCGYLWFIFIYIEPELELVPRKYPVGFGKRLLEAYLDSARFPFRADLRRKFTVPGKTDVEAFMAYPCNPDQWEDAALGEAYDYIWSYKNLNIPTDWREAIAAFNLEYTQVRMTVTWINTNKDLHY